MGWEARFRAQLPPVERANRATEYRLQDVASRIRSRTQLVKFLERFHPQARVKIWEALRPYVPVHLRVEPAPWLIRHPPPVAAAKRPPAFTMKIIGDPEGVPITRNPEVDDAEIPRRETES